MEEFLVTDFLVNGVHISDDVLFDNNEFRLDNDFLDFESTPSVSESPSTSGSPYLDLDVKMEDAQEDWNHVSAPVLRPESPALVLATQSEVNVVVKVSPNSALPSGEKASKKRRRESDEDVSDAVSDEISAVYLRREQLLVISSDEHEAFVQKLANTRDLTGPELKEVKRQRRLIKNREYAQTSRQKKKVTMGHVKEQVGSLESENDYLRAELAKLRSRVTDLELENASLRVKLSSKDQTSSEENSYDAVVDMEPKAKSSRSLFSFRPAVAASSVLFVFLFAFGFLFNSPLFLSQLSSGLPGAKGIPPMQHTGRALLTLDSPVPSVDLDMSGLEAFVPSDAMDVLSNATQEFFNTCVNNADHC